MHRSLYRPKACSQHVNWTDLNNSTPLHLALIGHAPATVYSTHLDLGWFPSPSLSDPVSSLRSLSLISYEHCNKLGRLVPNTCIPMRLFTLEFVDRKQQFSSVQFAWCEQVFIVKHVLWQHSKRTAFAETRLHTRHQTTPSDKLQSKLITVLS